MPVLLNPSMEAFPCPSAAPDSPLNAAAANVSFVEVESDKGHDAFLLEEPEMFRTLAGFLKGAGTVRGLKDVP